jgi:hypothetical protein
MLLHHLALNFNVFPVRPHYGIDSLVTLRAAW